MDQTVTPLPGTTIDPRYPDSDGRFMGETDHHNVAMTRLRDAIEDRFASRADVYVASNLVMYYREGDRKARKDPDVLVAMGVAGKHKRRSFRVWEEGVLPRVLFEIASRRTWRNDIGEKRVLYAQIGIGEYFTFDPERRYLTPPLQGFRTVKGQSVPIKPNRDSSLFSKALALMLVPEGDMLRLVDPVTGEPILTRAERADQEKDRADAEAQRAAELAAEVARLKARIADLES